MILSPQRPRSVRKPPYLSNMLLRTHVRAVGSFFQLAGHVPEIEEGEYAARIHDAAEREPTRRFEILWRQNTAASTSPFPAVQGRCEILQPRRLDGYIIIHKGDDFSARFADARVTRVGQTLPGLEEIAETPCRIFL